MKQTRDAIVPTIGEGIYTPNKFWQQTYRWSLATPTSITEPTPSQDKLDDLTLIEKRLENWFVKQSQSSVRFTGNVRKRFESLPVANSHDEFGLLNIEKSADGVITGALCKNKPGGFLNGECSLNKRKKKVLNNPQSLQQYWAVQL